MELNKNIKQNYYEKNKLIKIILNTNYNLVIILVTYNYLYLKKIKIKN